ncbi:hypothetical protein C6X98_06025 [Bacillus pumilus]|nr:hypothetical protein C6X97_10665 [Bacillus pumilus]PRS69064.1 hypothetical protein C6X98_06025 [Bacillus pumilus]
MKPIHIFISFQPLLQYLKTNHSRNNVYKRIIPAIMVIFGLWILLQISLNMKIFHNPMNYFVTITLFFLCIQALIKLKQ